MKEKLFFNIFKGLSLSQVNKIFWKAGVHFLMFYHRFVLYFYGEQISQHETRDNAEMT